MRRGLCALMTAAAVTALGATPAAASVTPVPDGVGSAQNASTITQGPNAASGGDATATGGNGGDANTGNTQVLNGNSASIALGPKAQAESQGGDTSAKSGDANGGDGGNAKASGGDAKAGNIASVKQVSSSDDGHGSCGCGSEKRSSKEGGSGNHSKVEQGPNAASGGNGSATGGNGGNANTGNEQVLNGNSVSFAAGPKAKSKSQGGDTSAKSGDANGGDGGNAKASGGDAKAGNVAHVKQVDPSKGADKHGASDKRLACGCPVNKPSLHPGNAAEVKQGDNAATGGEASATGGDGGYADTGNVQKGNGDAYARYESKGGPDGERCGCDKRRDDHGGASTEGGDTKAHSGDAEGGDGGDAKAVGGDAVAGNIAKVLQRAGRE
jgi:hypothetical protein